MSTPALNPLVSKIRSTYPGAYDDMDDAALTKSVLAKYPQYSDLAQPSTPMPGAPSTQPMSQVDITGKPQNPQASVAGLPGAWGNRPVQGRDLVPGAVAGGAAAAVASPTVAGMGLPFIKAFASKHPFITQVAASSAIDYAKQNLPGGKYIPSWASWLPFLFGPKGEKPAGSPDATGENVPYAGEKPPAPLPWNANDATGENRDYAGERAPRSTPKQAAPPTTPTPAPQTSWPPPEPTGAYDKPVSAPSGISDLRDDEAVREQVQNRVEQGDRKAAMDQSRTDWARNTVNRTKGEMIKQAGATVASQKSQGNPPSNDLTQEWSQNLPFLKAQKARQKGAR